MPASGLQLAPRAGACIIIISIKPPGGLPFRIVCDGDASILDVKQRIEDVDGM
jgi:hypothetical protein